LLRHTKQYVSYAALQVIGNIVTGNAFQIQIVLNCSVLPCLHVLLKSSDKTIGKDTCRTISNIISKNENQIQVRIIIIIKFPLDMGDIYFFVFIINIYL